MAFSHNAHGYLLPDLIFHQNLGFRVIIRSRNAKKPIMGFNDLNYSLVSNKTLSQKIGSLVLRPGPDDLGQNA